MAKIYVSTNASTGSGSLAEALSSASDGDIISFSENVFERGALIEIALAQTLVVDKNLTFDGGPFRVRSTPISTFRCAEIATGKNVVFTGFDFVGGVATGNGGGILCKGTLTLNSCKIVGCNASENGGGLSVESSGTANINDSLICGNKATSGNGGGFFIDSTATATLNGVTIAANTGGNVSGNATSKNSLIADDLTLYGFVSPPSSVPTSENWTWTDWQNWDFHLLDDGSYSPSEYRDVGNLDVKTLYDLDGNYRGRTANVDGSNIATCSPGCFETIQADFFWIGVDSTGAEVETPDCAAADGWAASRFATVSGSIVPPTTANNDKTSFIGVDVDFSSFSTEVNGRCSFARTTVCGGRTVSFGRFLTGVLVVVGVGATLQGGNFQTNYYTNFRTDLCDYAYANLRIFGDNSEAIGATTSKIKIYRPLTLHRFGGLIETAACYASEGVGVCWDGTYRVGSMQLGRYPATFDANLPIAPGSIFQVSGNVSDFSGVPMKYDSAAPFFVELTGTNQSATSLISNANVVFIGTGGSFSAGYGKFRGKFSTLNVVANATVKVDGDGLTLDNLTLNANAVLTLDSGYLGASSASLASGSALNGTGYYAFGSTTNDGGTFATTLTQVEYGAGITSFDALATAPTTATLTWTRTDATKTILIERQTSNGWEAVDEAASDGTSTVDLPAPGATNYRVWDGANFLTDAAWSYFGVQFSVDVAFVDSTIFFSGTNWITEAKLIPTGSALIGQSKTILARIYDSFSNDAPLLNNGLNIASTRYTIYKNTGDFFASGSTRTAVPGQIDVDAGTSCVLETMQTSDAWSDSPGYNFVLTPNNSTTPCFAAAGSYLIKVTIALTTGNPIVFGIEVNVS